MYCITQKHSRVTSRVFLGRTYKVIGFWWAFDECKRCMCMCEDVIKCRKENNWSCNCHLAYYSCYHYCFSIGLIHRGVKLACKKIL